MSVKIAKTSRTAYRQSPVNHSTATEPSSHEIITRPLAVVGVMLATATLNAADWSQWRGPSGNGHAPGAATVEGKLPPVNFDETTNVIWKRDLPGRGHGSPTIVGNRIYLATCDETSGVQSLMALERQTGQTVWQEVLMKSDKLPEIHNKNTHASSTVACDGERLFVTLYSQGQIWIHCHNLDGDAVWKKNLAPFKPKYPFGYAASPVLFTNQNETQNKNLVIATAESEAETALIGLDRATGQEVWRTPRPQNSSYSSPALLRVGGRMQLVMTGGREIRGYDPATGKDLWNAVGAAKHTAGTATGSGNLVISSGGYPESETTCVVADGSGKIAWTNKQKCYEQSMLIHDGYVYALTDKGVAFCWNWKRAKRCGSRDWQGQSAHHQSWLVIVSMQPTKRDRSSSLWPAPMPTSSWPATNWAATYSRPRPFWTERFSPVLEFRRAKPDTRHFSA